MRKFYLFVLFIAVFFIPVRHYGQTIQAATDHLERLEKIGDAATIAFFDYASTRFLDEKEKEIARKKNKLISALQSQENKVQNEKPFNGQMRLKNGYLNFILKLKQFPENLGSYKELEIEDYRTGVAQQKKKEFIAQLELLKTAASEVNLEVNKYITMNKLKDFSKGSKLPERWEKAVAVYQYCQKVQEAVLSIGAMDRYFHQLVNSDSLVKAEALRVSILQNAAASTAAVKIKPPVPTEFSVREAAINSFNLYRQDAFRNFKSIIEGRKKEIAFKQKYPNGAAGQEKNNALKAKFEAEKSKLESDLSNIRNLIKELKRDRDKHEIAFNEYLVQYIERLPLAE